MTDTVCRAQDCPQRHCYVCSDRHIDVTDQCCIWCLGLARRWLRAIPDHAAQISRGFGIANLSGGIPNDGSTGGNKATKGRPLPGGDMLVLLGPGSDHGEYQHRVKPGDIPEPQPVLWVLHSWERDWREIINPSDAPEPLWLAQNGPLERGAGLIGKSAHTPVEHATLTTVTTYLLDHLSWAANRHPAFDEFHHELRDCHQAIEHAAGMSQRPETDVTCCQNCPGVRLQQVWLTRTYDKRTNEIDEHGGLDDGWTCPHCKRRYSPAEYLLARKAYFNELDLRKIALDAAKAEAAVEVEAGC